MDRGAARGANNAARLGNVRLLRPGAVEIGEFHGNDPGLRIGESGAERRLRVTRARWQEAQGGRVGAWQAARGEIGGGLGAAAIFENLQ